MFFMLIVITSLKDVKPLYTAIDMSDIDSVAGNLFVKETPRKNYLATMPH